MKNQNFLRFTSLIITLCLTSTCIDGFIPEFEFGPFKASKLAEGFAGGAAKLAELALGKIKTGAPENEKKANDFAPTEKISVLPLGTPAEANFKDLIEETSNEGFSNLGQLVDKTSDFINNEKKVNLPVLNEGGAKLADLDLGKIKTGATEDEKKAKDFAPKGKISVLPLGTPAEANIKELIEETSNEDFSNLGQLVDKTSDFIDNEKKINLPVLNEDNQIDLPKETLRKEDTTINKSKDVADEIKISTILMKNGNLSSNGEANKKEQHLLFEKGEKSGVLYKMYGKQSGNSIQLEPSVHKDKEFNSSSIVQPEAIAEITSKMEDHTSGDGKVSMRSKLKLEDA